MLIECKEVDKQLYVPIHVVTQILQIMSEEQRNDVRFLVSKDAMKSGSWPFPTVDNPAIPWTAKQIQEYAKKQREDAGEALW